MQASIPPTPTAALVCTIQAVESSWTGSPIQGVRDLKEQNFRVLRSPVVTVEPRTVIDSRLTILAENFQSSGTQAQGSADRALIYRWSFEAPLGFIAQQNATEPSATSSTISVKGSLKINSQFKFELQNTSKLKRKKTNNVMNILDEHAQGFCETESPNSRAPKHQQS